MADEASTPKVLKTESKVVLPPWGNGPPPARPLSPKRARPKAKASVSPVKLEHKTKTDFGLQGVAPFAFATVALGIFMYSMLHFASWIFMNAKSQEILMPSEGLADVPSSIAASLPQENLAKSLSADSYFSDIEVQQRDVFILADPMEPHELVNYSAKASLQEKDPKQLDHAQSKEVFTQLNQGDLLPVAVAIPLVLMDQLKLGEVGTSWSLPQLPSASESADVSFRPDTISEFNEERPLTYKLQWFVSERPLTYKLEWFKSRDDLLLDEHKNQQPYELRWRK